MTDLSEVDALSLAGQSSVRALIETAVRFEASAHDFYTDLIDRVRPALVPLVTELADEERQHRQHLLDLLDNPEVVGQLHQQIALPHTAARFEALIETPDLPADPSDDDILALALAREEAAAAHYTRLAATAGHAAMRDAFAYLRDEEISHVAQLGERWGRLDDTRCAAAVFASRSAR
jgi:rubrerythrin